MNLDFLENLQLFRRSTIYCTNISIWLGINNLIIMHKSYFIHIFLRGIWIFRKIYLFLEDLQSVALMYAAANGSLPMNNVIIMHKTYFIQVFLKWTWIFRKIYLFLEDL